MTNLSFISIKKTALSMAVSSVFFIAAGAQAQLEEIVVTAQKRAESQQDVPIAIQSLQGDDLGKLGITDAGDVTDLFANINNNAANELNNGFTIRGVGTNNFHGNVARAVGVYQDEVSRGTPFSGVLGVYDMERIEVLRGPQNTLFGRNTTGGAINYISKKPSLDGGTEGYATAEVGNEGAFDLEGAVGIGISDTFGVRFSGKTSQRDGLFTNLAPGREGEKMGERDRSSFRVQGLWSPSDQTEVLVSFSTAENKGNNIGNKAFAMRDPSNPLGATCAQLANLAGGVSGYTTANNCVTSFGNNPSTAADWNTVYNVSSARADVEVDTGFLKIDHEFDNGISFTSISAFDETSVLNADDNGGGIDLHFIPHQDADYEQFSQELRLQGESDNFRWIGGVYYFDEDMRLATVVRRDANGGVTPPPAPGAGQVTAYNFMNQNDQDMSIYGQTEFDLSENTTITAGLRYTKNEKEATSVFGVIHAPHLPWAPTDALIPINTAMTQAFVEELIAAGQVQAVAQFNVECGIGGGLTCANGEDGLITQELSKIGAKIGIDHKLENGMIYASYSRGFKSGGFDTRALAATQGDATRPVAAETLDAYEIGYKWDSPDGTVRLNSAIFYNVWEDQQVFAVVDGLPALTNVPESKLKGAEVELTWAPDEYWLINTGIGILDSEITDNGGLVGVDTGHDLRNNPPLSLTGSISRDVLLANGNLNLFLKFRYQDEMTDSLNFNTGRAGSSVEDLSLDDFQRHVSQFEIDVRGTYTFGGEEQYSVALWIDNVTEEKFCNDIGLNDGVGSINNAELTGTANCSPSPGMRLFGLTGSVQF